MLFKFFANDFFKVMDGWPMNGMITVYLISSFLFSQLFVVISFILRNVFTWL